MTPSVRLADVAAPLVALTEGSGLSLRCHRQDRKGTVKPKGGMMGVRSTTGTPGWQSPHL